MASELKDVKFPEFDNSLKLKVPDYHQHIKMTKVKDLLRESQEDAFGTNTQNIDALFNLAVEDTDTEIDPNSALYSYL